MSKYTTEVRFICENYAGYNENVDYPIDDVIEKSREKVFDFNFPIFDESYRSVLETKFLKHYYTREIGFETVALWKLWLNKRLNEIMPYYNQLYKSETLEFNPFYDVDFTTKGNRNGKYDETHDDNGTSKNVRTDNLKETTSGDSMRTDNLREETNSDSLRTDNLSEATTDKNTRTDNLKEATNSSTKTDTDATRTDNLAHHDQTNTTENGTSQNTHYDLYSDTPQGALNGVNAENYLTNARKVTDNGTTSSTGSETNDGTNTGTVQNKGTQTVTGSGSTDNTGTQTNEGTGSKQNTGTQDVSVQGSKDNTGTQDIATSGEKDNTGTQTNEGNTTNTGNKNYTNVDDYLEHVAGKRSYATYSAMLKEYRETFLNIDMMIINELSDLFMNVW